MIEKCTNFILYKFDLYFPIFTSCYFLDNKHEDKT